MSRDNKSVRNKEVNKLEGLRRKLRQHSGKLLKKYKAEAIGIGYKHTSGKRTEKIAIIFFVKRKMPSYELQRAGIEPIPKSLFAYPTDVREVGKIRKY